VAWNSDQPFIDSNPPTSAPVSVLTASRRGPGIATEWTRRTDRPRFRRWLSTQVPLRREPPPVSPRLADGGLPRLDSCNSVMFLSLDFSKALQARHNPKIKSYRFKGRQIWRLSPTPFDPHWENASTPTGAEAGSGDAGGDLFTGMARMGWMCTFRTAAYNLVPLPGLLATGWVCSEEARRFLWR
jgi:hypothetical protein